MVNLDIPIEYLQMLHDATKLGWILKRVKSLLTIDALEDFTQNQLWINCLMMYLALLRFLIKIAKILQNHHNL